MSIITSIITRVNSGCGRRRPKVTSTRRSGTRSLRVLSLAAAIIPLILVATMQQLLLHDLDQVRQELTRHRSLTLPRPGPAATRTLRFVEAGLQHGCHSDPNEECYPGWSFVGSSEKGCTVCRSDNDLCGLGTCDVVLFGKGQCKCRPGIRRFMWEDLQSSLTHENGDLVGVCSDIGACLVCSEFNFPKPIDGFYDTECQPRFIYITSADNIVPSVTKPQEDWLPVLQGTNPLAQSTLHGGFPLIRWSPEHPAGATRVFIAVRQFGQDSCYWTDCQAEPIGDDSWEATDGARFNDHFHATARQCPTGQYKTGMDLTGCSRGSSRILCCSALHLFECSYTWNANTKDRMVVTCDHGASAVTDGPSGQSSNGKNFIETLWELEPGSVFFKIVVQHDGQDAHYGAHQSGMFRNFAAD
jgi:hypothetical protein